jgi:hypothetical protein
MEKISDTSHLAASLNQPSVGIELGHAESPTLADGDKSVIVGRVVVGDQLPMRVDLSQTGADVLRCTGREGIIPVAAELMVRTFVDTASADRPPRAATATTTSQGTGSATAETTANNDLQGDDIPDTKPDSTRD